MVKYKLIKNGIKDVETGKNIPNDPGNRDWKKYQDWLGIGNSPDPEYSDEELATIAEKEKRKNDIDAAIKTINDTYKGKKSSDITDAHAIELVKLKTARELGAEL
jgi:hypothetical protein